MKFIKEFKEFAVKGNVIDMAVGVIVGGTFGKIVTSLVNDVVMPALSVITGKVDISSLTVEIAQKEGEPILIKYGLFIQNVIDFLIVALCIFMFIKLAAKLKRKEVAVEVPAEEPKPTKEEELLAEIRDLLKKGE